MLYLKGLIYDRGDNQRLQSGAYMMLLYQFLMCRFELYLCLITNNLLFSDIDECTANTDNCDDTNGGCTNTEGSFTCSCNTGYNLEADGFTCTGNKRA
jgi:hypothetical protein